MLCLLFNLAIESLAQMLRDSNLKGMEIEEKTERLTAKLFADDTMVYLSAEDSIIDLQDILKKWCRILGEKFNTSKMVVVPVRRKEFQQNLGKTREPSNGFPKIPHGIKIA